MSSTLRVPYEKAMALGGVATGSMKAKEALMVQGNMTYRGWSLIVFACRSNTFLLCKSGIFINSFPELLSLFRGGGDRSLS